MCSQHEVWQVYDDTKSNLLAQLSLVAEIHHILCTPLQIVMQNKVFTIGKPIVNFIDSRWFQCVPDHTPSFHLQINVSPRLIRTERADFTWYHYELTYFRGGVIQNLQKWTPFEKNSKMYFDSNCDHHIYMKPLPGAPVPWSCPLSGQCHWKNTAEIKVILS